MDDIQAFEAAAKKATAVLYDRGWTLDADDPYAPPNSDVLAAVQAAAPLIAAATAEAIAADYFKRAARLRNQNGQHFEGCHTKHQADTYEVAATVARQFAAGGRS